MTKLTSSVRREVAYSQGGVAAIIVFPTFMANGVTPSATYTKDVDGRISGIVLAAGIVPVLMESEIDKAEARWDLVKGASTHVKHQVGFTLGGTTHAKNVQMESVDLIPHTYVERDRRGRVTLLGELNGLVSESNSAGTGKLATDLNGYDILVVGAENNRPLGVTASAFAELAGLVPAGV